jgi:M6 family metalloprotease-like protein
VLRDKTQFGRSEREISLTQRSRTNPTGVINNIVIFFRFAGDSEYDMPFSTVEQRFNGSGDGVHSLYQYYYDASYQQLEIFSHFFPLPNGDNIISFESSYPALPQYWGCELIAEAIPFILHQIPPDLILDNCGDGNIDNITLLIKGNWPGGAWMAVNTEYDLYINEKRFHTFFVMNVEYENLDFVSVAIHEMGHSLGLDDYYTTWMGPSPVGAWDMMAHDTNPPQSFSSYLKWDYLGWIPQIPQVVETGEYTLYPSSISPNHSLMITSPHSQNEFFIVEYRNNSVSFIDSALPGSGLLIYRINSLGYNGNWSSISPWEMYIYRPDGTLTTDGDINDAYFSLQSGRTAINNTTNPTPFLSNGMYGGLNITDIGYAGESITFTVHIDRAPFVSLFRESFNFYHFPPTDWTMIDSDGDGVGWYGIKGFSTGNGLASSGVANNHTSQDNWLISPQISLPDMFLALTYNVSNPRIASGSILSVYISTTGTSINDFVLLTSETFTDIVDWTERVINMELFQNQEVYIAFRHLNNGNSSIWIDNVNIFYIHGDPHRFPPQNLNAAVIEDTIFLSWDRPEVSFELDFTGYKLYLNNSLYASLPTDMLTYVLSSLPAGINFISLTAIYGIAESVAISVEVDVELSISDDIALPFTTALLGNFPNPFNPITKIRYQVIRNESQFVQIEVYNIRGQIIRTLVNEYKSSGEHSVVWDGTDSNGSRVSSGLYFYRMRAGEYQAVRRMILLK